MLYGFSMKTIDGSVVKHIMHHAYHMVENL